MDVLVYPSLLQGTLKVPASKSLSHRALICASLAQGTSHIDSLSQSRDLEATASCLRVLGAQIEINGSNAVVQGIDPAARRQPAVCDAYESGSTIRFLIPIAALSASPAVFKGQPSLLSRPMGIYADLFAAQNLRFDQSGEGIVVQGPLQSGLFTLEGSVSSQFISGLLMAAPFLSEGAGIAVIPPYQSRSYVDLTTAVMKDFGVQVLCPTPHGYEVQKQSYKPADVTVGADYSQAAFPAVYAGIKSALSMSGLRQNSIQGDRAILYILEKFGASISWEHGYLTIQPGERRPQEIDLADCPDLGPVLCVLAAYTPGETQLIHAARLRIKESDRISAMEKALKPWGVDISSTEDEIIIRGKMEYACDSVIEIDGCNDHRIVMAMTIFALCAGSALKITGAQAVSKSWPSFFEDMEKLGARIEVLEEQQ